VAVRNKRADGRPLSTSVVPAGVRGRRTLPTLDIMTTYRVLSNNWRLDGSKGLRIGRIIPSRGVDVAAWPVHLAPAGSERTLCGQDATELREFKPKPDRVAREDRCEGCYAART
jgi:hypothetical protein